MKLPTTMDALRAARELRESLEGVELPPGSLERLDTIEAFLRYRAPSDELVKTLERVQALLNSGTSFTAACKSAGVHPAVANQHGIRGRQSATNPEYGHGTIYYYTIKKCRCDQCRAANAAYAAIWRRRKKEERVS